MELQKRVCKIKARIEPYGAGWTDVYFDFGDGHERKFIISHCMGDQFEDMLKVLYHLYPEQEDYLDGGRYIDYEDDIPESGHFLWNEEGCWTEWKIERVPVKNVDFIIGIQIDYYHEFVVRKDGGGYTTAKEKYETAQYEINYKDFCYAVADAYTKALKKHGFWGYHYSIYTAEFNIRYLLFLKSLALNNFDARELYRSSIEGEGECSDFEKEIELIMFDMS